MSADGFGGFEGSGRSLFAEGSGELVAQSAVLIGELPVACVGCFETPQQRCIGGALPDGHGCVRCPPGARSESFDLGPQVGLGVEPGA